MTDDELSPYEARKAMLARSRALLDEWAELKSLGQAADRYC